MKETMYLMEAANGMLVRVPESKLDVWQKQQDALRAGEKPGSGAERLHAKLRERILGGSAQEN